MADFASLTNLSVQEFVHDKAIRNRLILEHRGGWPDRNRKLDGGQSRPGGHGGGRCCDRRRWHRNWYWCYCKRDRLDQGHVAGLGASIRLPATVAVIGRRAAVSPGAGDQAASGQAPARRRS